MHFSRLILPVVLLMLAITATPAYSTTITTYSSLASWQAASTGDQTIDFEGLAPAGSATSYPSGITQSGVQFIGISGTTIGVMDTSAFTWANFGSVDAGFALGGSQTFRIILPANITAFGIDLFSSPPAQSYTATVAGNQYTIAGFNQPARAFFGVTSDTNLTSVDFTAAPGATYAFFDNVDFGTATPEAGTFFLIGTGLVGLALFRRRTAR